ncbi:MAG TPA: hypothetical protein VE988_25170, partial [Gemmataceae bacterium]|nr:hypothetical protein [Gemmataceae bacterium]
MITNHKTCRRWALLLLSLFVCGCNLPMWRSGDQPPRPVDAASNWHGMPPNQQNGMQPLLDQPTQLPTPRVLSPNEQISLMTQHLANAEDNRKVLASRLQMV